MAQARAGVSGSDWVSLRWLRGGWRKRETENKKQRERMLGEIHGRLGGGKGGGSRRRQQEVEGVRW